MRKLLHLYNPIVLCSRDINETLRCETFQNFFETETFNVWSEADTETETETFKTETETFFEMLHYA